MQRFIDLKVWQRSHELTLAVYRASGNFPREDDLEYLSRDQGTQMRAEAEEISKMLNALRDRIQSAL